MKSMCDVAERLKNMGRQEERINAVKFAISLGASEEKILKQYSKEEYRKSVGSYESLIVESRIVFSNQEP